MTVRVQLLLALAALLSVVSSSENSSVSSSDGFGHELAMVGLDAVNFNMQKDHLRSKEYFQVLKAEIEAVQRTLGNIESMVVRQSKVISTLQSELEMTSMNVSHLLSDSGKIYRVQQTLATTEILNDFIIQLVGKKVDASGSSRQLLVSRELPSTCAEVPERSSGVRLIHPQPGFKDSFEAFCDQEYEGGGWTVIQNRYDGSVHFYRGWNEFENGFGDLRGEFWLGLRKIHELTYAKKHELHIVLEDFEGKTVVAKYSDFRVAGPEEKYTLKSLGTFSGDAGDSLTSAVNMKFTTLDADNDTHGPGNCAVDYKGGWWYTACHESNLNGLYMKGKVEVFATMMCWRAFKGYNYGLKRSRMMIRASQ
ncbi:hypothetical protein pipiens_013710 [Culex pipiens pipiens]|uniref:Fibrinogen C-terminal domain-containing protein n=2 Tax=Culex pipiens TaxID=7175 RepID=A0ABD1CZV8_CULPP